MTLPESWYLPLDPRAARHCHTVRRLYAEEGFKTLIANDEWGWKEAMARYWGLCKLVDRSVGKVLRRLDDLGLADDTIVVYTADHGHLLGEHRMWNKGVPYEPSVQVPLLLRVPGLAPRRITTPVSLVRLMPTLLELLGLPVPAHIQGTSLVPLLTSRRHRAGRGSGLHRVERAVGAVRRRLLRRGGADDPAGTLEAQCLRQWRLRAVRSTRRPGGAA